MRDAPLIAILLLVAAAIVGVLGGGFAGVIWRRKLITLLRDRHTSILNAAQSSPDVCPLGFPIASSSRILRIVGRADLDDPEIAKVARTLRRCTITMLVSMAILIAFMLLSKLRLW
jgi:hypothetical protein